MNIFQKRHSQIPQSLFRLSLKNTRILIKANGDTNQTLTGSCNQKTATTAGRDCVRCCNIQRHARTARRQSTETAKQQNNNENDVDLNAQSEPTDLDRDSRTTRLRRCKIEEKIHC
jgi:hypothetical protein